MRPCQKQTCETSASALVAVRYASREIVLGPLGPETDRRYLELCDVHAGRLTPPLGWSILDERRPAAPPLAFGGPFAPAV